MGWTGIFNWYTGESNKEILKRELFSHNDKCEAVAWSSKGSHVWILSKDKETGFMAASVVLTQRDRKDHEFLYKILDLSSGPCHTDMPKSWLKLIDKSYFENDYSKSWLERYQEEEAKPKTKVKVGDVFKCTADYDINFDGFILEKQKPFYVKVTGRKTRSKCMKYYTIAKPTSYGFCSLNYRLRSRTFNNLTDKELVKEV